MTGPKFAKSVLSEAAGGAKFPSWEVTEAYVNGCGGDPDEWRQRWNDTCLRWMAAEKRERARANQLLPRDRRMDAPVRHRRPHTAREHHRNWSNPPRDWNGQSRPATDKLRDRIRLQGTQRHYVSREIVLRQGDNTSQLILILDGRVKIDKSTATGRRLLMAIRGPGDIIGESSVLDGEPQPATVTALTEVSTVSMPGTMVRQALHSKPSLLAELAMLVVQRLREADLRRVEQAVFDATTRVVRLLLDVAYQHGDHLDEGIRVPLTQTEIAEAVAASPVAVALALRMLRERGAINTRRSSVELLSPKDLRDFLDKQWAG